MANLRFPAGTREITVSINKCLIKAKVIGKGKALVLVHGLGTSSKSWLKNLEAISKCGKVYAIDLPGFGESDKPDKILSPEEQAKILYEWCLQMDLQKISLCGHSFGGEVCLWFAAKYPLMVEKMALVATTGYKYNFSLLKRSFALLQDAVHEPLNFLSTLTDSYIKAGPYRIIRTMQKSNAGILEKLLPGIKAETLLINASEDAVISREESKKLAEIIPGAKLKTIEGHHGIIFDQAKLFNQLICDYLN